ncbi:MAG: dihydroneopterin aldolase [Thiotrichaceae bacterium]|nr:dihydroneopterin aldolase [Thiotrichaceae bacterium]
MDIVYVKDLRVDALIGIYDWERRIRQQVRIDLEMGWDNRVPAQSDDIKQTMNYKAAAKLVTAYIKKTEFQLVETLAENIATLLLKEFSLPWVKITLGKPFAVTGSTEVGVCIERQQDIG